MKQLKNFNRAVDELTDAFAVKYFACDTDYYWVDNDRSGVLCVDDYFFSLQDIVTSLALKATEKQVMGWHRITLDARMNGELVGISFRNYLKYGDIRKNPILP